MGKFALIAPTVNAALAAHLESSTIWNYYGPGGFWISNRDLTTAEVNAERGAGGRNPTHMVIPINSVVSSIQ